jgi:hypothetical protein
MVDGDVSRPVIRRLEPVHRESPVFPSSDESPSGGQDEGASVLRFVARGSGMIVARHRFYFLKNQRNEITDEKNKKQKMFWLISIVVVISIVIAKLQFGSLMSCRSVERMLASLGRRRIRRRPYPCEVRAGAAKWAVRRGHVEWCEELMREFARDEPAKVMRALANLILIDAVIANNFDAAQLGFRLGARCFRDALLTSRSPAMTEYINAHRFPIR